MKRLLLILATLWAGVAMAHNNDPADALRARQTALSAELARNAFGQPIHLDSQEQGSRLNGDVYAVLNHPFADLARSIRQPAQWCEVVILVINVKRCEAAEGGVALNVGRKFDQPLQDTYRLQFTHRVAADAPGYLQLHLGADAGPMGTSDYRIVLEAIPSDSRHSFIHLRYAYTSGFAARVAMQGYLSTVGRDKVGFSIVDRQPDGQPVYVRSLRGALERTTMRYYLAIAAYLDSLSAPPPERIERRLRAWFAATERYPRQLHEMDEDTYLALKRSELRRSSS
ncbi:MAG TPA: hypothetical protein VGJ35_04115 [Burkholderiaceae bacterium]